MTKINVEINGTVVEIEVDEEGNETEELKNIYGKDR